MDGPLIRYDWCPYEKGRFGHGHAQADDRVKTKTEIRAMCLQVKDGQ